MFVNRPFSARFLNCCKSLNFEAIINFNTSRQNELILALKLSELEQFENRVANGLFTYKIEFSSKWLRSRAKCKKGDPNFTARTTSPHPKIPFLMLCNGVSLIRCRFYSCFLSYWLFAEKFSNCSNSLNFEVKINFNTIKENCSKCRTKCTGLKLNSGPFNGPQTQIEYINNSVQNSHHKFMLASYRKHFA